MKTYEQLNESEQKAALDRQIGELVENIVGDRIKFNDELNGDDLQARIESAWEEATRQRTPWFIGEILMEKCGNEIRGMAQCQAEDCLYSEPGECVVSGIVKAQLQTA